MIFGPRLEPNHDLEEYVSFDGDDTDFIRTCFCIKAEEDIPCTFCGGCEERTFACSEDYYEALMDKEMEE